MDENQNNQELKDLSNSYAEALNIHGYGFQYRVAKEIESLHAQAKIQWYISAIEYPINIHGKHSRIDLILKHNYRNTYIVVECKRANPAYSDWVFSRSPYSNPVQYSRLSFAEEISIVDSGEVRSSIVNLASSNRIYQIGLELKTDKKGDRFGSMSDQIEKAATQACLGFNGLADIFSREQDSFGGSKSIILLPMIVTSANLFSSSVDLGKADINTGEISPDDIDIERVDWLNLHYHQSPGLKHSIESSHENKRLNDSLYHEYVRTIPVLHPDGLHQYLCSTMFI